MSCGVKTKNCFLPGDLRVSGSFRHFDSGVVFCSSNVFSEQHSVDEPSKDDNEGELSPSAK